MHADGPRDGNTGLLNHLARASFRVPFVLGGTVTRPRMYDHLSCRSWQCSCRSSTRTTSTTARIVATFFAVRFRVRHGAHPPPA